MVQETGSCRPCKNLCATLFYTMDAKQSACQTLGPALSLGPTNRRFLSGLVVLDVERRPSHEIGGPRSPSALSSIDEVARPAASAKASVRPLFRVPAKKQKRMWAEILFLLVRKTGLPLVLSRFGEMESAFLLDINATMFCPPVSEPVSPGRTITAPGPTHTLVLLR